MPSNRLHRETLLFLCVVLFALQAPAGSLHPFLAEHCLDCHDSDSKKGGLDLSGLSMNMTDRQAFAHWVKVYDQFGHTERPAGHSDSIPVSLEP